MNQEERQRIKDLLPILDDIELFEGQAEKSKNELTDEEIFQLHLNDAAEKLAQTIEVNIEFDSLKSNLDTVEEFLSSLDET